MKQRIRDYLARRFQVPRIDFSLERLRTAGFAPSMVFDVGAYQGDFAELCCRVWPRCRVACCEVQREPLQRLRTRLDPNRVQVFECLLGSSSQPSVGLNLAETASSVLVENAAPQSKVAHFPMRSLDEIVSQDLQGRGPDFLKMDVQGYELEVLKGAERSLPALGAILAEVNLLDLHAGVPLLHELIAWLAARGWVSFDICGLTRRPLDQALWQADFLFVPATSSLRGDKRWA